MIASFTQKLVSRFLAIDERRLPRWMGGPFDYVRQHGYDHLRRSQIATNRRIGILVRQHAVPVNQPLVLISQIPRSGGTLLSQLFDGHPECYAHPSELRIGKPKRVWPKLNTLEAPETLFERLFEDGATWGYRKGRHIARKLFIFPIPLQRQIFLDCICKLSTRAERDVLDAYFTAYFNAWLNYQTAYHPKKIITAFAPGLALRSDSMSRFFANYPDGRVISIVRNPLTWFPSVREHGVGSAPDLKEAIANWCRSANAIANNKVAYGDRCCILKFDDLVLETAATMKRLADWLGIQFDPILTVPTFNTIPTTANSSFAVTRSGILKEVTKRESTLAERDRAYIEEVALPLYATVCDKVLV
jgi:hypothetical protein